MSSAIEGLYAAALWLMEQRRYVDAIHVFRSLVLVAPAEERGWLGVGTCHEALDQPRVALEIYSLASRAMAAPRCLVARARILRALDRGDEADLALDDAAARTTDATILDLIENERRAA